MAVMGEEDRLARAAEFGEKAKRAGDARLVEARQQIVADEGQGLTPRPASGLSIWRSAA